METFNYIEVDNIPFILSNVNEGDVIFLRNLRIFPSLGNVIYEKLLSGVNSRGFSHVLMVVGKRLLTTFPLSKRKLYSLDSTTNRFSIPDIYGNEMKGVQIRELNDVLKTYVQNGGEIYWLPISIKNPNILKLNIFVQNVYGSKFRNYFNVAGSLLLNDISEFHKLDKKNLVKYYLSLDNFESICSEFVYSLYIVLGIIQSCNNYRTKYGFDIKNLSPSQLGTELINVSNDQVIYFVQ